MPFTRSLCKPPGLLRPSVPLALSWNSESLCAGEAELLPPVSFVLLIPALGSPLTSGSCFPQRWKTGGARSGQTPFIRLEPCLPPRLLQSPLGAQHVSLDFIRIKEMSHICKQALLSRSSPAAVRRGRRGRKPCVAPCSGRTGSFIIVASISLQGRAIANKWLAGSQKETIWPTRRTYLHL